MKTAVIDMEPLRLCGLRYIMQAIDTDMELCPEDSDANLRQLDRYDAFIVSAEMFLSHSDFFMIRRDRTLVMTGRPVSSPGCLYSGADFDTVERALAFLASNSRTEAPGAALSVRETEVLRELAAGKSNKEIADTLAISTNTVITHRKNISQKLGIRSVSGLSLYAMLNGILQ